MAVAAGHREVRRLVGGHRRGVVEREEVSESCWCGVHADRSGDLGICDQLG